MTSQPQINNETLTMAKDLVKCLESNDDDKASELIQSIAENYDPTIFNQIGKLTRGLHEKLRELDSEINLGELNENEIRDAKIRLNYVIEKTSEATDRTLNIVESIVPAVESINSDSIEIQAEWNKFLSKEMDVKEFRKLATKITAYLEKTHDRNHELRTGLNDIIVAQSYQDTTGQVIQKVIGLVQDVEDSLVRVIKCTSSENKNINKNNTNSKGGLEGPSVPGVTSTDSLSTQDEVDDLLSSLGF